MEYISIGKIINFHGIKGEAKVGYSNLEHIKGAKTVYVDKNSEKFALNISNIRFHKNFAIIKFVEINSIDELIEFKGKNIYSTKEELLKKLAKNEFLIDDLIGLKAFDNEENYIGEVVEIQKTPANDILCIKSEHKKEPVLIPFVSELVPIVDIKTKKVIIKPIGGLIWGLMF